MEEACKSLKLVRFFIFSPLSFSSHRFFFVGGFCPTDFTDLHRYSSSWFFFIGFHGGIGGILVDRITHGISRNFGRWPMARALYLLLLFLSRRFRWWRRFFFVEGFCPTDFTDIHRFYSSWFFFIGFHRWIGRHSCLSDYSRIFAELWPLANGSRPIYTPVVFCHADFADDADFSSWEGFCPTDFTDLHRFFMESLVNLFVQSQGVSVTTGQVASAKIRE